MALVPIIDFSPFLLGNAAEKEACARELLTAMQNVGFVMLSGFYSKTSKDVVDEAFTQVRSRCGRRFVWTDLLLLQTKAFFDLPREVKDGLAWTSPESNRGYVSQGRERVTQATDAQEIEKLRAQAPGASTPPACFPEPNAVRFLCRLQGDDGDWQGLRLCLAQLVAEGGAPGLPTLHVRLLPQLPQLCAVPCFPASQSFLNCFYTHSVQVEVMRALALAMGLGETFFDGTTCKMAHNLRLCVPLSTFAESPELILRTG